MYTLWAYVVDEWREVLSDKQFAVIAAARARWAGRGYATDIVGW